MNKIEKDGKIGVLVSPGFGAGWSTWADDKYRETLCMDAEIVQAVLDGDIGAAVAIAKSKCADIYDGGASDLVVRWVEKGTAFEINDYDGNESLRLLDHADYMVA